MNDDRTIRELYERLLHNTPAAFHGRPQLADALTQELREALERRSTRP